MTGAEAKWAVVMASLPSAAIITAGIPAYALLKDSSAPVWLFWVFVALIPMSVASGLIGAFFSFERSITRALRVCLLLVNAASVGFGLYLATCLYQAITMWKDFRSY